MPVSPTSLSAPKLLGQRRLGRSKRGKMQSVSHLSIASLKIAAPTSQTSQPAVVLSRDELLECERVAKEFPMYTPDAVRMTLSSLGHELDAPVVEHLLTSVGYREGTPITPQQFQAVARAVKAWYLEKVDNPEYETSKAFAAIGGSPDGTVEVEQLLEACRGFGLELEIPDNIGDEGYITYQEFVELLTMDQEHTPLFTPLDKLRIQPARSFFSFSARQSRTSAAFLPINIDEDGQWLRQLIERRKKTVARSSAGSAEGDPLLALSSRPREQYDGRKVSNSIRNSLSVRRKSSESLLKELSKEDEMAQWMNASRETLMNSLDTFLKTTTAGDVCRARKQLSKGHKTVDVYGTRIEEASIETTSEQEKHTTRELEERKEQISSIIEGEPSRAAAFNNTFSRSHLAQDVLSVIEPDEIVENGRAARSRRKRELQEKRVTDRLYPHANTPTENICSRIRELCDESLVPPEVFSPSSTTPRKHSSRPRYRRTAERSSFCEARWEEPEEFWTPERMKTFNLRSSVDGTQGDTDGGLGDRRFSPSRLRRGPSNRDDGRPVRRSRLYEALHRFEESVGTTGSSVDTGLNTLAPSEPQKAPEGMKDTLVIGTHRLAKKTTELQRIINDLKTVESLTPIPKKRQTFLSRKTLF